jgi:hypothetical protein
MGRPPLLPGTPSATISVAIEPHYRQAYEAIAETEATPLSTIVRRALKDWLCGRTRHDSQRSERKDPEEGPCPHCRHRRRFHLEIAGCEVTKRDGTICPCTWGMVGDEEETA